MTTQTKKPSNKTRSSKKSIILGLRTCKSDLTAYGGFQWPKKGVVKTQKWDPKAICGNGLHFLPWGVGDFQLLNWNDDAKWLVVAAEASDVVSIDNQKSKAKQVTVVYCGDRAGATKYIYTHGGAGKPIVGLIFEDLTSGMTLTGGYGSTLTGGNRSTLTGGYGSTLTGGDYSTLTGGNRSTLTGGYGSTLTGGYGSTLTGGDYSTLTGGDYSTLTGGDYSTLTGGDGSTLTGGYGSTLTGGYGSTLTGGDGSTLTGGDGATLIWKWYDDGRTRVAVGVIGENDLKPGVKYTHNAKSEIVEVK